MFKKIAKKIITFILIGEAKLVLKICQPKIIAVTGNVGKTSTKDAIYLALKDFLIVRRSEKSYNSELGVPLTILGQNSGWSNFRLWLKVLLAGLKACHKKEYPKWLVLEVGADHPGDIKKIVKWLKPDIAVVTRLPEVPVHIEFFKNKEEVIAEKMALVSALKETGSAIFNLDDPILKTKSQHLNQDVISYGQVEPADVRADKVEVVYKSGLPVALSFNVDIKNKKIPVVLEGVLGEHQIYAFLGAVAVAFALKLDIHQVVKNLVHNYKLPPGRFNLLTGIKNSLIIDDTYNSSPEAVTKGIDSIKNLEITGRRIAVLGDMLELGQYSTAAHFKVGGEVAQNFDILITFGHQSKLINEGATRSGLPQEKCFHFDNRDLIVSWLKKNIRTGDLIFIKGSQSMRLEKVVARIMASPELKSKLLCRQDAGWENL
ncbi:MAG: UDP-N-acetylmuramoyl-tripeptide--D-alanyl-D-alanine ligase [Candidatus Paceibacterota bacterium]